VCVCVRPCAARHRASSVQASHQAMSSATARSKRRRVSNGPLEPEKKSRVPPSRSHSKPQAGGGHGGSRASEGVRAPSVAPEDVVPPAALPLRPAARRACAGILDFFSDTGIDVSWRNVRFDPDELSGGWRVVAARDAARGEVLGTVPKSACLSVSSTLFNMPAQQDPTSRTPPQMCLPCCKSSSHAALAARRQPTCMCCAARWSWPPRTRMLHECSWPPRTLHGVCGQFSGDHPLQAVRRFVKPCPHARAWHCCSCATHAGAHHVHHCRSGSGGSFWRAWAHNGRDDRAGTRHALAVGGVL
jgi:hypothetical protein